MFRILLTLTLFSALILSLACEKRLSAQEQFSTFLAEHTRLMEPLHKKINTAYWNATSTGDKEEYEKITQFQIEMKNILSDTEKFAKLKSWKESGKVKDPLLARQLDLIYTDFLENQIDKELRDKIVKLSTELEETFNTHRGAIDAKAYADNELLEILRTSTDPAYRKKAWEAQKSVGAEVAEGLIALVKLRNEAARKLGYDNYFSLKLHIIEQEEEEIFRIFDELAALTQESFNDIKSDIDTVLAARYGIEPEEMRPWHYQDFFFQRAPDLGRADTDVFFKDKDIKVIATDFYGSLGFPVREILDRSDLYERDKKYQHAYQIHIDKKGDVRIMTNLRNDANWMSTLIHELGHAVYDASIDMRLPFRLREAAHILTTEAIAQMFERVVNNPAWLKHYCGATDRDLKGVIEKLEENERNAQLIFCRWSLVMLHFEKALYSDPDQDLNTFWWDRVEDFQQVQRPEGRNAPDWASKIHLTTNPVYYHNYMLGQLMAAQLLHTMAADILKEGTAADISYIGHPELGTYLKEKIFAPGARVRWDVLIRQATGEPPTSKYFARQFVKAVDEEKEH